MMIGDFWLEFWIISEICWWLRCVFGEISHLDFHVEKKLQLTSTLFFEWVSLMCIKQQVLLWLWTNLFVTQGPQQKALSSSGAVHSTLEAWAKPVLVESGFDESCWSLGCRWCFWRPWWKSRSWNIFENATSKVLRMCRLGGRCTWGCWLVGGGCWMISSWYVEMAFFGG